MKTMQQKKERRQFYYRLFIGLLIIAFAIRLLTKSSDHFEERALNLSFKGVVQDVHYDSKGIPIVTVGNKKYFLMDEILLLTYKIKKGDTIIKYKKDLRIRIIRPGTRDTIYDRDTAYRKGY